MPRSWSRCRAACGVGGGTVAVEFVTVGHAARHGHDQGQGAAGHQRPGAGGEGAVAGLQLQADDPPFGEDDQVRALVLGGQLGKCGDRVVAVDAQRPADVLYARLLADRRRGG